MAYENFKPTVWSKKIQHELEKMCVMQEDCNTEWQGEVGIGKKVKIIGATRPTVKTYTPGTDIDTAETPADTSMFLEVDQYKYTHFVVDDIDEAQAMDGVMEAYMKGSAAELAETRDAYLAKIAAGQTESGMISASTAITTEKQAKAMVDAGFVQLWSNSVRVNDDVSIVITPWFYNLFKNCLVELNTSNADLIHKGVIGLYNGAKVKMSNNLYTDGTDDCMVIRTKRAIAFAHGIEKVEPYRPEKQFADAVKVLDTYGAKIARPKELYIIKAHQG